VRLAEPPIKPRAYRSFSVPAWITISISAILLLLIAGLLQGLLRELERAGL
jgi:hypothetical protein